MLREQISKRLLPELCRMGFQGPSHITGNALLHEFKRVGPTGNEVLTIQMEKHGLPRFILGLYMEPPQGIEAVIAQGGTVISGQLKARKGASTKCWFRADPTLWQRIRGQSGTYEERAVNACIALLPELESWWVLQAPTEHIAAWPVTYPGKRRG